MPKSIAQIITNSIDAYWASQPTLLSAVRQRAWWGGYVAGVLSSVAAVAIGVLAIYLCLGAQ